MPFQSDDVLRVANYAHIALKDDEIQALTTQISQSLASLEEMTQVNTNDVPAMINPHDAKQILREDVVAAEQSREVLLSNAPLAEEGLFLVPRVIE